MSYAIANWLRVYAEWREKYLQERPEKRLFPWLLGGLGQVPKPEEPIITLGPKGEELKNKGIVVIIAVGVLLALASRSD